MILVVLFLVVIAGQETRWTAGDRSVLSLPVPVIVRMIFPLIQPEHSYLS